MPKLTQAELAELNSNLENRSPVELLEWARGTFGDRVAILSAMQKAGSVVCHMAAAAGLKMDVLFVDTGVNFQETLDTRDRVGQEYGLNVISLQPDLTMEQQTAKYGVLYLTVEGQKQCCEMRKNLPLYKAKGQYDALVGSLRRGDGGKRGRAPILAIDTEMNVLRVNVLANFTDEQMKEYMETHDVVVNPLHEQGFTTIGCNRCTTPVLPDEPKRAGRWRHLGPWAMYCGINPTDLAQSGKEAVEFPTPLIEKILGKKADFVI